MEQTNDFDNVIIQNEEELFTSAVQEIPIRDTTVSLIKKTNGLKISEENHEEKGDQYLDIFINESVKIGEGMSSYVAYKVVSNTNMPIFKKKNLCVMRRFSDFLGLHEKLCEKYLRAGRIIPPAPEKSVLGTTKVKMSNNSETANHSDFVERRRQALERYIRRTAQHPVFRIDPDFREFLEADIELPRATNTSTLSGAGVMRLFNKVGETVNKITYKMDETDPWFEDKNQQIENLDLLLRKFHNSMESLVIYRRELATNTGALGKSIVTLSNSEEHTNLATTLAQLGDLQEKIEAVHNKQADKDFYLICEMLKDYSGLIGSVKDIFHERTKVFQNCQHSQQMLSKKREIKSKFESQGLNERADDASNEVTEWESKVERNQEEFNNISAMIKKELEAFEESRIAEFKQTLIKYLEEQMERQAELVNLWELFLTEAKSVGAS